MTNLIQLTYKGNPVGWTEFYNNGDYTDLQTLLQSIPHPYTMGFVTLPNGYGAIQIENSKALNKMRKNYQPFKKYINSYHCKTKHATAFYNKTKDVILVIPCNKSKNFTHILDFAKNASEIEFKSVMNLTFDVAQATLDEGFQQVYITTHGTGVGWLHLRINSYPKYFKLINGVLPTLAI